MSLSYFGGAIFTPEEVFTFIVVAVVIAAIALGTIIYFGGWLLGGKGKKTKKKFSLLKSMLIGFGVIIAGVFLIFVVPTIISDARSESKQDICAKKAGYENTAAYSRVEASPESKEIFISCLNPSTLVR